MHNVDTSRFRSAERICRGFLHTGNKLSFKKMGKQSYTPNRRRSITRLYYVACERDFFIANQHVYIGWSSRRRGGLPQREHLVYSETPTHDPPYISTTISHQYK